MYFKAVVHKFRWPDRSGELILYGGHVIFVDISVNLASWHPFDSKNFEATPRISENVYNLAIKKY
jgi:hypothetical protein